jgi:hypothetical protein
MMRRIVLLLFCVVLAVAAYRFRDPLLALLADARADRHAGEQASPELADSADRKLAALANGEREVVALSGAELQSLLEFRYTQVLPAFVDSPSIEIRRGRIRVGGRVPVENLPSVRGIGEAAAFLPDTAELAVTGQFLPLGDGRVALGIDDVSSGRIPLPRRLLPGLLRQLGREDEPGLPSDALPLPLPPGARDAYLRGDSLYRRGVGRASN